MKKAETEPPVLGDARLTKLICSKLEIEKNSIILNAGVNIRESTQFIAKKFGCKVFGISEIPQIVIDSKRKISELSLSETISIKIMSPVSLDFEDKFFDVIIAEGILSQYKKSQILKEFYRVLKDDGSLGIADFYWKKTPVPTYVKNAWDVEGGEIEKLDEKIEVMKKYGFEPFFVQDASDELRTYYSKFAKIIKQSLKETKFTRSEFKEVKKFKHEVSVFLEQGGDKWMGYAVICARKRAML